MKITKSNYLLALVLCITLTTAACSKEVQKPETPQLETSQTDSVLLNEESTLQEIFQNVPEEYCPTSAKEPLQLVDTENYFIVSGEDVVCEFTVFVDTESGFHANIYGVSKIENGVHETEFLKYYENDNWLKAPSFSTNLKQIDEEIRSNTYIQLPQLGTAITFIDATTAQSKAELIWNGSHFVTLEEKQANCPYGFTPEHREQFEQITAENGNYVIEALNLQFSIAPELQGQYYPFLNTSNQRVTFGPTNDAACLGVGDAIDPGFGPVVYLPDESFKQETVNFRSTEAEKYVEPYLGGYSIFVYAFDWNETPYSAVYTACTRNNSQSCGEDEMIDERFMLNVLETLSKIQ